MPLVFSQCGRQVSGAAGCWAPAEWQRSSQRAAISHPGPLHDWTSSSGFSWGTNTVWKTFVVFVINIRQCGVDWMTCLTVWSSATAFIVHLYAHWGTVMCWSIKLSSSYSHSFKGISRKTLLRTYLIQIIGTSNCCLQDKTISSIKQLQQNLNLST